MSGSHLQYRRRLFPKTWRCGGELLAAADAAMYDAKAKGRNGLSVYSGEMLRGPTTGGSGQS